MLGDAARRVRSANGSSVVAETGLGAVRTGREQRGSAGPPDDPQDVRCALPQLGSQGWRVAAYGVRDAACPISTG